MEHEESDSNSSILTELVTTITTTAAAVAEPLVAIKEDASKADEPERSGHVPYILNGELYEIRTQDGENVTVKCCHCPPDRVYRGSVRSTGNFHMHIKRRHPDLLGKLHDMKVNALLERRDRLLKNRKIGGNRNNNAKIHSNIKRELQTLATSSVVLTPPQETQQSPMHTHKLKIKRAFQRHQLQQQEAMRNWNLTPFAEMPTTKSHEVFEQQPINYSFKESNNNNLKMRQISETPKAATQYNEQPEEIQINTLSLPIASTISSEQMVCIERSNSEPSSQQPYIYENQAEQLHHSQQQKHQHAVTEITPCPSTVSSYGSNISIGNEHLNSMAIVKNETFLPAEHAIDLTIQNNSNSSMLSSGIGSESTLTCTNSYGNATTVSAANTANTSSNFKWDELLLQVETSLRDIQREMRTRNQIETNRILLDIAKFKYLHPGFNFQY